jgi:AcrR family transcriptional regulator
MPPKKRARPKTVAKATPRPKLQLVPLGGVVPEPARNTRLQLLAAGKTLFAKQGFEGTSVKQVADLAGVNISLVSYHFGGKENLYRAILLEFGQERLAVANRVLQTTGSEEEFRIRAKMFADEMLRCHFADPELSTILHRACEEGFPLAQDVFRDTFVQVFGAFERFIAAAQKRGLINSKLRAETLSGLLFGSLVHMSRSDNLNQVFMNQSLQNSGYRAEVVEHFLELVFPSPKRN